MKVQEVLDELKAMGNEKTKAMLMRNHAVKEPCYGVKVGDLKTIQKRVKVDHDLALGLYDTGNYDAMYLAGLIADDARMTKEDLRRWAARAEGGALAGSTVPWVAAGSRHGHALALEWIDAAKGRVAATGWATLSCLVALKDDADLDLAELEQLLNRVRAEIHPAPDETRYSMNMFVISVGAYVAPLTDLARSTAESIGTVTADLGNNQCSIPHAPDYLRKIQTRGAIGKKRKTVKC